MTEQEIEDLVLQLNKIGVREQHTQSTPAEPPAPLGMSTQHKGSTHHTISSQLRACTALEGLLSFFIIWTSD